MSVGMARDLCAKAEGAEHHEDIFDICHDEAPLCGGKAVASRPRSRRNHQEMPYLAAMRRAFASSLS